MAVLENPPSYVPESNGLNCPYTLDFNADLTHILPLRGMWQGSPVQAKTLYVNNYSNNFTLTIKAGTNQSLVPALSQGYVNIEKFDEITIVSESGALVTIGVLDYPVPSGFTSRGNAPNSLTSDPYFSSVLLLTHFENSNGSTLAVNSKTGGALPLGGSATISNLLYKFGSSSMMVDVASKRLDFTCTLAGTAETIEFYYSPLSMADGDYCLCCNNTKTGFTLGVTVSGGSIVNIFYGKYTGVVTKTLVMPYTMTVGSFYNIAMTAFGGIIKVFVNGVLVGSLTDAPTASSITLGSNLSVIFPSALGFYDEYRITEGVARYLTNYTQQTTPFLDQ